MSFFFFEDGPDTEWITFLSKSTIRKSKHLIVDGWLVSLLIRRALDI